MSNLKSEKSATARIMSRSRLLLITNSTIFYTSMATSLNNKSSMVHDFSVKLNVRLKPYKLITSNNAPSQQKNILKSIIQLIAIQER